MATKVLYVSDFYFVNFKLNFNMAKLQYETYFNDSWLNEDVFKALINKVPEL